MAKFTTFPCPICGWAGLHPCVIGKVDSVVWLRQIPKSGWHGARLAMLKKLKAQNK